MNVVPLIPDEKAEQNKKEVIRLLEEALSFAKDGKPQSLAIIMINDGDVMDCYHHGGAPFKMIGAIEALKIGYIRAQIEGC